MRLINIGVFTLVLILAVAAYLKGANRHILGITEGMKTLASIIATTAFYTCFFVCLPENSGILQVLQMVGDDR